MNSIVTTKVFLAGLSLVMLLGITPAFAVDGPGGISDVPQVGISGPINIGALWNEMSNGNGPLVAMTGCSPADPAGFSCIPSIAGNSQFVDAPPWTFSCAASGCSLKVTDAFNYGDQFEVFDFGVSIGTTSVVPLPPIAGEQCGTGNLSPLGTDPDVCFADPLSSSGIFFLASGAHSITITQIAQDPAIQSIAAYFRVDRVTVVGANIGVDAEYITPDTTALLLAGVQSISMWMIPVVLAGIGIGVFVIKRRK